ncbi:potassium transporter TrkA [Nonomuraea sp. KC401]|uniref:CASTOR/POLLUX-related putative ion channel n=1 Tax=unclassified Nonomuraea TaxID=2593643 RepID=UPI0010FF0744|nr:TrkA C-terminal domain-containing protein [Nonomuraea sp. KC401]NBE99956.1 potassium transporter TrkA [Nonomuraea sp. K271]TLF54926.1 potassium transporter TrkA [Nonomuraea sp. KC401]
MSKITFRERARYWFDNTMSRGTASLIGWLAMVSLALIVVVTVLTLWFAPNEPEGVTGPGHVLWLALMHALSPGKISSDEGSTAYMTVMFAGSLGGIFIVSMLVGLLSNGLKQKVDRLRRGRSRIVESGHTVVLGWSDQVFTIVAELAKAQASQRSSVIAILAERDKLEMEEQVREQAGDLGKTRIVCRTGRPTEPHDLDLMNLAAARSVVVLSPEREDPDAHVIKILLALAKREGVHPPAVAALTSSRNMAAARLAGGDEVHLVDSDDTASRLIVQSSRQSGMSVVCMDLLNFDGGEIYLRTPKKLVGVTYGEALHAYQTASLIGLRRPSGVVLNPQGDTVINADDQVIVIAHDDSDVRLAAGMPYIEDGAIVEAGRPRTEPERTLLLNWNGRAEQIVRYLDGYVAPGAVLEIAADHPKAGTGLAGLRNLTVNVKDCDTTDRFALESLGVGLFQHVIVLSDDRFDPRHSDTRTLMTLLQLRDMQKALGEHYSIVSEMHDENNRSLAEVTQADDIVISDTVIGLLLAQLAENRHLADVFGYLFDSRGSEIYPRPAASYVKTGAKVSFSTVVESARRRGETAIGYRKNTARNDPPHYGIVLNPDKTEPIVLEEADSVIVLAER